MEEMGQTSKKPIVQSPSTLRPSSPTKLLSDIVKAKDMQIEEILKENLMLKEEIKKITNK